MKLPGGGYSGGDGSAPRPPLPTTGSAVMTPHRRSSEDERKRQIMGQFALILFEATGKVPTKDQLEATYNLVAKASF